MAGAINRLDDFNRAIETSGQRLSSFSDTLANSVSSVQGLTSGFRNLSGAVTGIGLILKNPALVGAGAVGALAGATAGAGLGLAGASSPNGLASVDKAFTILAGTIGSVVQPYVVALGGAAMMAGEWFRELIDSNLDSIIDTWVTAIDTATTAVMNFAEWLKHPVESTANWMMDQNEKINKAVGFHQLQGGAGPFAGPNFQEQAILAQGNAGEREQFLKMRHGGAFNLDFAQENKGPSLFPWRQTVDERTAELKKADKLDKLADNMMMITKDMRSSMVQPNIQSPVDRWKEIALQIQKSDLDRRMLEMQERNLRMTEEHINALREHAQAIRNHNQPARAGP